MQSPFAWPALVATSNDDRKLMLFDTRAQWTQLTSATIIRGPFWSRDSRFVYYQDVLANQKQPNLSGDVTGRFDNHCQDPEV